jgi:hypothetical protein
MHNLFFQHIMYDKTRVLNPLLVEAVAIQRQVPAKVLLKSDVVVCTIAPFEFTIKSNLELNGQ